MKENMSHSYLQLVTLLAGVFVVFCNYTDQSFNETCTVTSYNEVATATSKCSDLVIDGITVPAGEQLLLELKSGAKLTFKGTTKFEHYEWKGPLVMIKGSKVTVTGAAGAVLDGQGAKYWDGKGGSGSTKPKFFKIQTTGGSSFTAIHLKDCPMNCVSINKATDTTLDGWTIDVSAGDSQGGHNTDGFDVSSSSNIVVENSVVKNQDDCVAVNQGYNYLFKNLTCSGGHGLSLSVGLSSENGSANTVKNVTFSDCTVTNSRNGIHVKTHSDGGTGSISDVTYSNIKLSGIINYGINVEEDYERGSPTGKPKGNVPIENLNLKDVTGSMSGASSSMAVYILCGEGGCNRWTWTGVSISNNKKSNECNFIPSGFSC